jgi:hypothetical protein
MVRPTDAASMNPRSSLSSIALNVRTVDEEVHRMFDVCPHLRQFRDVGQRGMHDLLGVEHEEAGHAATNGLAEDHTDLIHVQVPTSQHLSGSGDNVEHLLQAIDNLPGWREYVDWQHRQGALRDPGM